MPPSVRSTCLSTKALQQSDKHCIRIAKLMEDARSRFHERESYVYNDDGLLYHINRGNGKEYKAMVIPKTLIKLSSRRCMTTYSPWSKDTTIGPK